MYPIQGDTLVSSSFSLIRSPSPYPSIPPRLHSGIGMVLIWGGEDSVGKRKSHSGVVKERDVMFLHRARENQLQKEALSPPPPLPGCLLPLLLAAILSISAGEDAWQMNLPNAQKFLLPNSILQPAISAHHWLVQAKQSTNRAV